MSWRAENLLCPPCLDDTACVHHCDCFAHLRYHTEIVCDQQDREAQFSLKILKQRHDLRLDGDVESGGRFIGYQQPRFADDGHGDHHTLAQSSRKLMRILIETAVGIADANQTEDADHFLLCIGTAHTTVQKKWFGDLLTNAKRWVKTGHGFLKHHADAITSDFLHTPLRCVREILALEQDLSILDL